ncbi:MAG: glycosyltransferase family 39 protein [Betaproteobacteria bacterium]
MAVSIGRSPGTRLQALAALGVGLAFRLWIAAAFPYEAGDTPLYEALARSLDAHRAYALEVEGRLVPVDVRMPGYPALLAASHALFGPGFQPVRVVQAVVDTLTCLLAGAVAALLALPERRRRAFLAALWLSALCPFTANYVAAILAETPGAFWNTGSIALLLLGVRRLQAHARGDGGAWLALLGSGVAAGIGCYFRPETPLVLMAAGVVLPWLWWRPRDWRRLAGTGGALGLGLALALAPWAARNVAALGRFEVLPPPAANLPGEMAPTGFNEWLATWLTTNQEIYDFSFKVEDEPLLVDQLPPSAYDSPQEKERVARLFAQHNADFTLTPELDGGFAQLARERTARHPLRTYLLVPLKRVATMWISPRLELLPWSGEVFPLRQCWEDDPYDLSVTVVLFTLDLLYLALALVALRRVSWRTGAAILVAYLLLRTALITQMPGPEPRYVVICFPLLAALAAQLWAEKATPAPSAAR